MQDVRGSPWGRALRLGATVCALSLCFVASLALALVVHLDMGVTRRSVQNLANVLLGRALVGDIHVGEIERLSSGELRIVDFRAALPAGGDEVLFVEDVRLQGEWLLPALAVLLRGEGTVVLPYVRIERARLGLDFEDNGRLTLAQAFSPRPEEKPAEPPAPPEPPRIGIELTTVEIGRVDVDGAFGDGLPVDATVSRLVGYFEAGARGVFADIGRSSLRERRLLGAETSGTVDYHIRAERDGSLATWGSFSGHLGALEIHAQALYRDGSVEAEIDLPRVGSRELRPWLPGRPLERPVSARARITGLAPLLKVEGEASLPGIRDAPAGKMAMQGTLHVSQPLLLDAEVQAERLDVRLFGADLPTTELNARARLRGRLAGDDSELFAHVQGSPSRIAGELVPALSGIVAVARAGIESWLVVEEQGSPADVHVRVTLERGLEFSARVEAARLAEVPRLRQLLGADAPSSGRATVVAEGRVTDGELDVRADARVNGARMAGVTMSDGRVHARLRGPSQALHIDARARGAGLTAAGQRFERFQVTARGPASRPSVQAELVDDHERTIQARALVDPRGKAARNIRLSVEKGGAALEGTIEELTTGGGGVRIEGIKLSGLQGATLDGGLRIERGELVGKLKGRDVDLGPLSKLLGMPYRLEGKAELDIDLARDPAGGRRGHIKLQVVDAGMLVVSGVSLDIDTRFEGESIEPRATLRLRGQPGTPGPCGGTIAELSIPEGEGTLAGPLLEARSWRRITGRAKVAARGVDLRCLADTVGTGVLPLSRIEGVIDATVELERAEPDARWSLPSATLRTRNLVLAGKDPPFASEQLDLSMRGSYDAESQRAEIDVRVLDERAPKALIGSQLLRVHGSATLDIDALLADNRRRREALLRTPFSLALETERRPLKAWQALPSPAREHFGAVDGEGELDFFAEGTLREPSLALRLRAWDVRPSAQPRNRRWTFPVDVDVMANHVDGAGRLDATVRRKGELIASLEGTLRADIGARLTGERTDDRWTGSLSARVRRLPLDALPPLADKEIAGEVDGHVSLDGLGDAPLLNAKLDVKDLSVGKRLKLARTRLTVRPVEGEPGVVTLVADVRERCESRAPCGDARATAYATLLWDKGLLPSPDPKQPAAVYLTARSFPLSAAQPLVTPTVSKLDGRITGAARLAYREILGRDVALDIDMRLEHGVVHVPMLGQEFYDVRGHIRAAPNIVKVDGIHARAAGGELTGKLNARFDGLAFKDLVAELRIDDDQRMPIRLQGVPLGTASVEKVVITARNQPEAVSVAPVIHGLRLEVPPVHDVQDLEDHPEVRISHTVAPPSTEGTGGKPVHFTVHIDRSELHRGQLRIGFRTRKDAPIVYETDTGRTSGIIELTGGQILLLGKMFHIDRGHVRFRQEEPDNPYVSMTARWESPNGSTIFIDYIGPLMPVDRDKVHFRSNPPKPEDDIVADILFGDSEGPVTTGEGQGRNLGSRIAAQQINDVLGEMVPGLSTAFGTTDEASSASLIYHFSDRVSAQATYESQRQDAAATGNQNDPNKRNTRFSVDWRFAPNFILRGSIGVGDEPSSGLDVLWQYRY